MKFFSFDVGQSGREENGYVLLVLLLFIALLSVGFLAMIQRIDFEIKRDREEEMIHRGVQYSRAVRKFVSKIGRYPSSIEELENTNNTRFLRKRYKDPVTGKDFKILHLTDIPSYTPSSAPGVSVANLASQQQATASGDNGVGTNNTQAQSSDMNQAVDRSEQSSDSQADGSQTGQNGPSGSGAPPPPQPLAPRLAPNVMSHSRGGSIIGVASTSKEKSIREFNKKDHYNQWQFIYDPSADPAGVLNSPSHPPLAAVVAAQPAAERRRRSASLWH